ncbi:5-carboxymethyl-2-hydroxymuconate Delta-isomerase [Vibrio sp. WXL210]|uniref:5-carboxymethyl-2-hydroxymuconate Delta-isomerase n=1 Tax=Vibrio sp. WXL210 TaxID=3450709 RepID=UPI003EC78B44
MPNLIMEYTNTLEERVNVQGLLEDLHQVVLDSGLFELNDVRSRALRYHHWLIGEHQDDADFIHLRFELLAGRSDVQKQTLSEQLMTVLQTQASQVGSLSVDVRDMDPVGFCKRITL